MCAINFVDLSVFYSILPNSCFVLKKELLNIPLLGKGLKCIDSIPINRNKHLKSFKDVLKFGKNRLLKGLNIIIFPEGTRVKPGMYPKFHKTAISLARITNTTIILVAHNSGLYWPNYLHIIKPGCVTIHFCKAILPNKFKNTEELNNYCHKTINNTVILLRA